MKKRIFILNTGGTISSVRKAHGYEPVAGYAAEALARIQALQHPDMPDYVIEEYAPLLDSSNMTVDDWNRIAKTIQDRYEDYDGFIIYHGTDTMAYTASMLSFMLENLAKPVILTGSQLPLSEVRNDAYDHVVASLWLCAHYPLHEVCIYFNQQLLRGNRSRKVSVDKFHAFNSPNFPPLANMGTHIELAKELLIPKPQAPFSVQKIKPQAVANFRLYPGFSMEVLSHILQKPLKGLVLETFGAGNAPNNNEAFLALLRKATEQEILVINCTQCIQGSVAMGQYATGYTLYKAGLVSGQDMTPEAVHSKLLYLFSKNLSHTEMKTQMLADLCGELTKGREYK